MKKLLTTATFLFIAGIALIAQSPPAPPENAGSGGGPVGGGAPVGGGLMVLMALSAAYSAKKVFSGQFRAQE